MQTQIVLNDTRPRPRIHSTSVIASAAKSFLIDNKLFTILSDFSAGDEEWLQGHFINATTDSISTDAWAMASEFAKEMNDAVCEEYVDLFDNFVSHLSSFQDSVLRDWVTSGGATNPLGEAIARVEIETREGIVAGIAFNDARYAETGKFTFLADDDRETSIGENGEIIRRRVLEWEMIRSVALPSDEDTEINNRDAAVRSARDRQSKLRLFRNQAERERNVLLAAHPVTDAEAASIFATLGLDDEISAARAANAIIAVLTRRAIERLA